MIMAALVLSIAACKEEEKYTSSPSLDGSLNFQAPEYISQDTTLTFVPSGLSHPDGEAIKYSWKVSPVRDTSETSAMEDGSYTFEFGDSLGTYTVTCQASASGYASSSRSRYITMVKGGLDGSITGTGISAADPKMDGLYYTRHGDLYWSRTNLTDDTCGIPYLNEEVTGEVFGRFYSYEEALTACPEGWRLPTNADWNALAASIGAGVPSESTGEIGDIAAKIMGDVMFNGEEMWKYSKPVGEISNTSALAVIPAGYVNLGTKAANGTYPDAVFYGLYEYAAFWTADEVEGNPSLAYYRLLTWNQPYLAAAKGVKTSFGASVRCVKDVQ